MKKIISFFTALGLMAGSITPVYAVDDDFVCGEWKDVLTEHMEILTDVCEYGLMQGYSSTDFGYGEELSRAEAATIVNRLVMGSTTYDNLDDDMDYLVDIVDGWFSDYPDPNESDNYWILQAMAYSLSNQIFQGDDTGNIPTTYRPDDTINIVETFKVFYEAAVEADIIHDDVENEIISYDGDPWWEELMYLLENEGVFVNLDTDYYQSFWFAGPLTVAYSDFSSEMNREDAAIFLYYMIQSELIDAEKLEQHVSTEEEPPNPEEPPSSEEISSPYDLAVTELYLGSDADTAYSVYVQISNFGTEEIEISEDLNLQLFVNEDEPFLAVRAADLAEEDDDFLQPGGVSTFGPYEYGFMEDWLDETITSVTAFMDEDEVLAESDETNNLMTLDLE